MDLKQFSCVQDLQYVVSEEMATKQKEFIERLDNLDEVKSNDTQKITQFNNYFQQFKKVLGGEIQWHQAVIKNKNPQLVDYLKLVNIDVQ